MTKQKGLGHVPYFASPLPFAVRRLSLVFLVEFGFDKLELAYGDAAMSSVLLHGVVELGPDKALAIARHEPQAVHEGLMHEIEGQTRSLGDRQLSYKVLEVVCASSPMIALRPAPHHLNEVQLAVVLRGKYDRAPRPLLHLFGEVFVLPRKVRLFAQHPRPAAKLQPAVTKASVFDIPELKAIYRIPITEWAYLPSMVYAIVAVSFAARGVEIHSFDWSKVRKDKSSNCEKIPRRLRVHI